MLQFRITCLAMGFVAVLGASPTQGGRVKWSQRPDESSLGIDIRCDRNDAVPRILADDFKCTTTGLITDVHLWGSWKGDVKGGITKIHLSIHSDVPAVPPATYSRPGALLWQRDFLPGDFAEVLYRDLTTAYEGWWDPYRNIAIPNGDRRIWQYDINIRPSLAFKQVGTPNKPVVYWLDVHVETDEGEFGWKTAREHWNDTAVRREAGTWLELRYPPGHPYQSQPIDMAFEITTTTSPYVAINSVGQWQAVLQEGRVLPVETAEWARYMMQWSQYRDPGSPPYPSHSFAAPELVAMSGDICGTDNRLPSSGLLMMWASPSIPAGSYSSAWKYRYPQDPDLTNVIITVTVNPPCAGINVVSLGLVDVNGNIRAWYWNVPGALPCGVASAVSVDTSVAGAGAATPVATAYASNPAFDITQVETVLFDENCQWVAGAGVPPPGQTVPRPWNYWYDLTITPKLVKDIGPVKWSQPPVELNPGVYLGWDEVSVLDRPPLMADDWQCKDQRPVSDIHWWGSFLGWTESHEPPEMPIAFRFGIWTDVPVDPTQPTMSFSHPGELIWQYECTDYEWAFVGYDKDPRKPKDPAGNVTVSEPTIEDSCFQFNCVLPETAWFYQQPITLGQPRIYWLSIAAVYPTGTQGQFPWGWKTRPHHFNDDAVRMSATEDGAWPPGPGAKWSEGEPVEYPEHVSWDLAFELTTREPEPARPFPDLNLDRIVDMLDLVIVAEMWLVRLP